MGQSEWGRQKRVVGRGQSGEAAQDNLEEERGQMRQSEGADGRGRRSGGGRFVGFKFQNPAL